MRTGKLEGGLLCVYRLLLGCCCVVFLRIVSTMLILTVNMEETLVSIGSRAQTYNVLTSGVQLLNKVMEYIEGKLLTPIVSHRAASTVPE